jgi:hypothetical protein
MRVGRAASWPHPKPTDAAPSLVASVGYWAYQVRGGARQQRVSATEFGHADGRVGWRVPFL